MNRFLKLLIFSGAAAAVAMLFGFVLFAASVSREPPDKIAKADGIVVLTGPHRRIEAGIKLLNDGYGRRLLISGVNRRTSRRDVFRTLPPGQPAPPCCVDFGYEAQDTIGNADETRAWVQRHGFTRLIVVTASYHMPRSLNELSRALPDVELIPHPVVPRMLSHEPWWLHVSTTRLLAAEYLKLFPSAVRYLAYRLVRPAAIQEAPPAATPDAGHVIGRAG
jgi:uncharacterized SAM-binding protein YcdF (DUF218 family)